MPDLPDNRDHLYSAPLAKLRVLPTKADLRRHCPRVYNQGQIGSCTANAIAAAIEFDKPGQNVVWLDGFEFSTGTLEFDAKGKSAPPQSCFVGVAFRTVDDKTYDAVYFRPFNFRAADPERKSHAVQYVSEPQWPWQRLRQEKPGQFEKPIEPAPDGDAWFHAKVIIEKRQVRVHVNGATEPSLVVNELSDRPGGSVGLWCNGYGAIANLKIMPKQ